jgi:hypothetical protein
MDCPLLQNQAEHSASLVQALPLGHLLSLQAPTSLIQSLSALQNETQPIPKQSLLAQVDISPCTMLLLQVAEVPAPFNPSGFLARGAQRVAYSP